MFVSRFKSIVVSVAATRLPPIRSRVIRDPLHEDKTMHIIFTKRLATILFMAAFAALALAACGNDTADAAAASPTVTEIAVEPTATQVVIEVTAAPVPTETPVPTATVQPTLEPTIVLTQDVADNLLATTKEQPAIEFPAAISKGADALESDAVISTWTDFLTGARHVALNETIIHEFCSDGTGTWVWESGTPGFTGQKFDWELVSDPGATWRSVIVIVKMHDQKLYDLLNYSGGDGWRLGLSQPNQYNEWQSYESPDCT